MNKQKQIIALAEFDGAQWYEVDPNHPYKDYAPTKILSFRKIGNHTILPFPNPDKTGFLDIPNYLEDLNAINKLEKKLTFEQRERYVERVQKTTCGSANSTWWDVRHAAASECAESLLKTINKWED